METMHEILTIMGILGIPSIFTMVVWCIRACRKYAKQISILMMAQQAQMRTKLLELYHVYMEQGWVSDEQLTDWENQYQAYHSLGKNGVLDARRAELYKLPNTPPKGGKTK